MKLPETNLTHEQIKALTPEQYRAEVNRLMAEVIADFAREMNRHRTAAIIAPDGTADEGHDCSKC